MAKGIFFNVPEYGHVNPTLPLVEQLARNGETILYYDTDEYRKRIEKTGAQFRPYRVKAFDRMAACHGDLIKMAWFLAGASREIIDNHLEEIIAEKPDYIIHDSFCAWGKFVARYLNLPAVNTTTTFVATPRTMLRMPRLALHFTSMLLKRMRYAAGHLRCALSIRRDFGVGISSPMSIFSNSEPLNIVFTSGYFHPNGNSLGPRYVLTGPSISARDDAGHPDFQYPRGRSESLVYISLGTIFNRDKRFFRTCIDAFGSSSHEVVISLGGGLACDAMGPLPSNIRLYDHVPQLEVLKAADLFISHGGMNSVNESLYFGVPLILFPQQAEQATVARRVQKLGAGICAGTSGLSAPGLLNLTREILDNSRYRERARRIGDTLRAAGGYRRAAHEILKLVHAHQTAYGRIMVSDAVPA